MGKVGWMAALGLAACSVDSGGFPSVASSATATYTTSASDGTGKDSGDTGDSEGSGSGSDSGDTASVDDTGSTGADGGGTSTGDDGVSAGSESSTSTTGPPAECMGEPLDPQLQVPPMCSPTCTGIGFGNDCPGIEVCRLEDSVTAVCEGCDTCGNLHAPCTASNQCDILFTCFKGQCTAMCDLDTPQTCGNPAACTDVGHATHGVCDPFL